jgi:YndJ-like protein
MEQELGDGGGVDVDGDVRLRGSREGSVGSNRAAASVCRAGGGSAGVGVRAGYRASGERPIDTCGGDFSALRGDVVGGVILDLSGRILGGFGVALGGTVFFDRVGRNLVSALDAFDDYAGSDVGRMDLAIAAAWLLASRFGPRPMGFQEPIVLLTAVHFHYTGFASSTILAAVLKAGTRSLVGRPVGWFAFLVLFVPFVLAVGFVYSPFLKMAAGIAMVVAMSGLAVIQLVLARRVASRASRAYLFISSFAVAAGMGMAGIYAVGDWLLRDWLVIPQVAQTHGVLNALGFSLCGILGRLIEFAPTSSQSIYFTADDHAMVGMK